MTEDQRRSLAEYRDKLKPHVHRLKRGAVENDEVLGRVRRVTCCDCGGYRYEKV